jgi:hypothetical protein
MTFDKTQIGVARGMAFAAGIVVGLFAIAFVTQWPNFVLEEKIIARLQLAAHAILAPTAVLLLCIARLAKHRFSTPEEIGGGALAGGTEKARLLQSLLQNTLEQTVLAIPLYFAASFLFPLRLLPLVACSAFLFIVGRLLFLRGYSGGAQYRALGFGLTFYPSVALLLLIVVVILFGG